jgi:hypothetical protein
MSAAYTFHVAHPDHAYMGNNVEYYRSLPQADPSYFTNLEERKYQVSLYMVAVFGLLT